MLKELMSANAWTKTSRLIHEKYGKKIEFQFLSVAQGQSQFYSEGDDLVIPLKSNQTYLGNIVVHRGATLDHEQKFEVADLIQFLIQPQVYNMHLKLLQTEKQSVSSFENNQENIVSLFGYEHKSKPQILSPLIHLKSKSENLRHKVALKLHEMNDSSFFTRFSDICNSVHTLDDIKSLKGLTIYIEDISTLSAKHLQLFQEFSNLSSKVASRLDLLILIGSNLSETEIHSLEVEKHFKNDLIAFLFDIDRVPLQQQTSEDVLSLLFFNSSTSLS